MACAPGTSRHRLFDGVRSYAPRVLAAVIFLPVLAADSESLSASEQRGQRIYHQGSSPSGEKIIAFMPGPAIEVEAVVLPCASCHGTDGRGRIEGSGSPTDITWSTLARAEEGQIRPSGRLHPPYTAELLERAISTGVDPAGTRLHAAMPRYRMNRPDMEDLLAYLLKIGDD